MLHGDLISPYLFVLTMERLSYLIQEAVSKGSWRPIMLGRGGPVLSHLFFADDLVLFSEANLENAREIHEILYRFCYYSGHKVNSLKSKIFFSTNTDDVTKDAIENLLGFQQSDDLGTYLGMPLFHSRIKTSTFHFILDKIQKKLNAFDAELLSLAGRILLAKSVLLTIPGYFMQTVLIPKGICDKIEQMVRCFVWGSTTNDFKVPLVKWEDCCKSVLQGGVGMRQMFLQNTSYLMKLAFSFVTKIDALWVRVLCAKYKVVESCPKKIDRTPCSYVWRSLSKIWEQACDRFKWSIGNGQTASFALDDWVPSIGPLHRHIIPGMSILANVKVADFVTVDGNWDRMKLSLFFNKEILDRIVSCHPPPEELGEDICTWKLSSNGNFTLKSAYKSVSYSESILEDGNWKLIWKNQLTPRIKHFLWLARNERLLTNSERVRRKMVNDAGCVRCGAAAESVIHGLRDCEFAVAVWKKLVGQRFSQRFLALILIIGCFLI